jgi:hypothetical protein
VAGGRCNGRPPEPAHRGVRLATQLIGPNRVTAAERQRLLDTASAPWSRRVPSCDAGLTRRRPPCCSVGFSQGVGRVRIPYSQTPRLCGAASPRSSRSGVICARRIGCSASQREFDLRQRGAAGATGVRVHFSRCVKRLTWNADRSSALGGAG